MIKNFYSEYLSAWTAKKAVEAKGIFYNVKPAPGGWRLVRADWRYNQ